MAKRRISGFEGEDDKMKTACKVFHVDLTMILKLTNF
jgi:hypothetical protein